MQSICVIGSLNVDLTVSLPRFHAPGETITGTNFQVFSGGKGENQAVAAARLGVAVRMVGCVGDDENGAFTRRVLAREGIDASCIHTVAAPTGVALIEVTGAGDNRIAVVPGANGFLTAEFLSAETAAFSRPDIYLMQLETPLDGVGYAAQAIHAAGGILILDPAPAVALPDELLACADYLTPNETELAILSGTSAATEAEAIASARTLIARGAGNLILKRGAAGAIWVTPDEAIRCPGFSVSAIDTTAAGDTFNAAFAAALARNLPVPQALRFANAAAALSTTAAGAQAAMPNPEQVNELLCREASPHVE